MRLKLWTLGLAALGVIACGVAKFDAAGDPETADVELAADAEAPSDAAETSGDADNQAPDDLSPPPDPVEIALILDFDMSPALAWRGAMASLQALGYQVTYRRWFPHVAHSDVSGDNAAAIILVGAGQGPAHPTELMRIDDAKRLTHFVTNGGTLILAPRNTWQDAATSDAEWVHMNRILEGAGAAMRIERNTVIGSVSIENPPKPPLHITTPAAYPGPLEWTLNLPVGYPAGDHVGLGTKLKAFAAGYLPTLACDGEQVAVLATVHSDVYLWLHHGTEGNVALPDSAPPVAALTPVGDNNGVLAIIPRSLFTLGNYSATPGDQPVLFLDLVDRLHAFTAAALEHVVAVAKDSAAHTPQGCHSGSSPLFSATAGGLPPLGDGPVIQGLVPPISRPVAQSPPTPPLWALNLWEAAPVQASPPLDSPDWFSAGRAHMGYGGLSANTPLAPLLAIGAQHGLDSVVITVEPSFLSQYDVMGDPPAFANAAALAQQYGLKLLLGAHYRHGAWGELKALIGVTKGAQNQQLDAPPPLSDIWWDDAVRPLVMGAALASVDHPGVGGISLDMELYGAGALWYEDGHAFDVTSWKVILDTLTQYDEQISASAESLKHTEYLPWLIEQGLLQFAYKSLEDAVAARAAKLREDARAVNPDFELAFYAPLLPLSWYYRGLMRGWGTAARPLTVLSYDPIANVSRNALRAEGIHIRALGGVIGGLFHPLDFKMAMRNAGARSDGYWLFALADFPDTADPEIIATKNGPPLEYWKQLKAANELLDQLPVQ